MQQDAYIDINMSAKATDNSIKVYTAASFNKLDDKGKMELYYKATT
jgi:hypothetical protein